MAHTNTGIELRFYQGNRLSIIIHPERSQSIFRLSDLPIAETDPAQSSTKLLAIDSNGSAVQKNNNGNLDHFTYTPYGHDDMAPPLIEFNGEAREEVTGWYLLGNGYRTYSPPLGRFMSPDNLSPFNSGGLNSYAYVQGDPINKTDPSGHFPKWARGLFSKATPRRGVKDFIQATRHIAATTTNAHSLRPNTASKVEKPSFFIPPINNNNIFAIEAMPARPYKDSSMKTLIAKGRKLNNRYNELRARPQETMDEINSNLESRDRILNKISEITKEMYLKDPDRTHSRDNNGQLWDTDSEASSTTESSSRLQTYTQNLRRRSI